MSFWRYKETGINYLQYSNICARLLRRALKPELQEQALKVEETNVKIAQWTDGKAGKPKIITEQFKQHQTG